MVKKQRKIIKHTFELMQKAHRVIEIITADPAYKGMCKKINPMYCDDLFQEVCLQILEMPAQRIPPDDRLRFWFYRVAFSTMTSTGTFGKIVHRDKNMLGSERDNFQEIRGDGNAGIGELTKGSFQRKPDTIKGWGSEKPSFTNGDLKKVEQYMIGCSEFENRVILLYNKLGSMKAVQRQTNISYSALRAVKEKLKSNRK